MLQFSAQRLARSQCPRSVGCCYAPATRRWEFLQIMAETGVSLGAQHLPSVCSWSGHLPETQLSVGVRHLPLRSPGSRA